MFEDKTELTIIVTPLQENNDTIYTKYAKTIKFKEEEELYEAITSLYHESLPIAVISTLLNMIFINGEQEWGAEYFDGTQWHRFNIEIK